MACTACAWSAFRHTVPGAPKGFTGALSGQSVRGRRLHEFDRPLKQNLSSDMDHVVGCAEAEASRQGGRTADDGGRSSVQPGSHGRHARGRHAGSPGADGSAAGRGTVLPHRGSVEDLGARVVQAVHSVAERTAFQPTASARAVDGALGEVMYDKFKQFDAQFLQPVFGGGEHVSSAQPDAVPEPATDGSSAEPAERDGEMEAGGVENGERDRLLDAV